MDLDAPGGYMGVDPQDALADVEATAEQWAQALDLAAGVRVDLDGAPSIVVLGMGGSGIAGDVVAAVADQLLPIPVLVHKGYGLPAHVGKGTVVLAASYSGDTEETLSAVDEAIDRGAKVTAVTSGGHLGELADTHDLAVVRIPGGGQPRHSLGYLAVPALCALGLDDGIEEAVDVLRVLAGEQGRQSPTADNPAKQLALRFADGAVPVVYGTQGLGELGALRLASQLNENAKLPAFPASIPELDHNAIVGWEGPSDLIDRAGLVWVRDPAGEHHRNAARVEITGEVVAGRFAWSASISSRGTTIVARAASLLLQADLVSCYAALGRDIDPTPVRSIDRLKDALSGRAG